MQPSFSSFASTSSSQPKDRPLLLLASSLRASVAIADSQVRASTRGFLSRARTLPCRAQQAGRSFGQADHVDGLDEGEAAGHGQGQAQVFVGADATEGLHGKPSGTELSHVA